MEKISIQSTYTQVSLYARLSGPTAAKKDGTADAAAAAVNDSDPKNGELARSKDGDTFTLSIEARTLQITKSITIESDDGAAAGDAAGKNGTAAGKAGQAGEQDRLTGHGLVNALMDALQTISETTGQGKTGKTGKHHHHFPHLSDADDVANQVLSRLDQDHAAKGGSKEDFAADLKKRLGDWKSSSAAKVTVQYQEFRSEVHMKLTAGVDAWLGQGDTNAGAGAGDASGGTAGSGPDASAGTASQALTEI